MLNFKVKILFIILYFGANYCYGINKENDNKEVTKKDTISALVIAPSNPFYNNISSLSGNQIVNVIDSLLELDNIPKGLIKEINDYAESKLLTHDFYNSLTYFYENSAIPANSTYGKWDTRHIYPYSDELTKNDSSIMLTLTDSKNYCDFVNPITNPVITSNFGWRNGRNHHGIDLDLQVWDPVMAAFDGMVRVSLMHPGYGRVVVIRHYNGLETLYAHLHRLKVKTGDIVSAGQVIGLGGSSGQSSGSHLHFEVRYKGKPLNPRHIISFKQNKLISDSLQLVKHKWNYTALPVGVEYHTIERGDFMYKIATRYGITVSQLCELNACTRKKRLIVGRKLRIN